MKRTIITTGMLIAGVLSYAQLTGCANAVLVATDPRSVSTTTEDQYIKRDLGITYMGKEVESDHIEVNAYDYEVLLTGQASSEMQRYKAARAARKIDGVTKVYDYLKVSSKYTSTSTEDTYITAKVKTQLFGKGGVNSNDVQVITSDGVVYFMGIIQKSQLKNMVNVARSVDGVKDVVPLVHYKKSDTKLNLPD